MSQISEEAVHISGLEHDEAGTRIVAEELRLLAVVLRNLDRSSSHATGPSVGPGSVAEALADDERRLLELRDDVADAKPEDLPSLFEQMHTLGALRAHRGKTAVGSVDPKSPYFGHLRLEELVTLRGGGKRERRRDVLVGSRQFVDSSAGIRIVDWRNAPVSRLFYRYREGDSYEETLGDQAVEGAVLARRMVTIYDGQLRKIVSPEGIFVLRNGVWGRAEAVAARLRLPGSRSSPAPRQDLDRPTDVVDRLLPEIAALLDKEQYEIITQPTSGLLAIQGSAGSGKTTVGLHRIAYLASSQPHRFRASRMLVIVPSEALIHYTARVLPQLGVDDVPVATFARWGVRVLHNLFPKLPSAISEETPPLVSRLKSHPAMLGAIDEAAREVTARVGRKLAAAMSKWSGGDAVVRAWNSAAGPVDRRLTQLAQWSVGKRELGVPLDLADVTRSALEALGHELRRESRAVLGLWDEVTTDRARMNAHFGVSFGTGQLDQIHEWCVRQARIRAEGERDGDTPSLDAEDAAILLRSYQALRGPLVDADGAPLTLAHLFVDEVQDASPIELRVLLDAAAGSNGEGTFDPAALSVTLAGDFAQRMGEEGEGSSEFDWDATLKELGVAGGIGVVSPLRVSYRSTAEITSFARAILGPLAHEAEPIATRHGPPVELFTFSSAGESVAFLADALRDLAGTDPNANVALLARFPQQADIYYEGLVRAEIPNVRRVRKQDFSWERGFDITDVRQTKGLEFDEVVLLETTQSSYPVTSPARHALYVGATRAAHQLWCVSSEAPSTLVTVALPEASTGAAAADR